MKWVMLSFLLLIASVHVVFGMTRSQLKKTLLIPKRHCMNKFGVSEAQVGDVGNGHFVEEPKVMCYITCVYQMLQVIKNGRLDKEMVYRQVDTLFPQEMKAPVKAAIDKCIDIQYKYEDMCEGVFWSVKCLYETDPANFLFP